MKRFLNFVLTCAIVILVVVTASIIGKVDTGDVEAAKPEKVCWLNKGGQYHLGSPHEPRDDQEIVDMKYCQKDKKDDPAPTDKPRDPTNPPADPTAFHPADPTSTPKRPLDPTDKPDFNDPTATEKVIIYPTNTPSYKAGNDPVATRCINCACPEPSCSLATIAAAQATIAAAQATQAGR